MDQGTDLLGWPYLGNEMLKEPLYDVNATAHLFLVWQKGRKC